MVPDELTFPPAEFVMKRSAAMPPKVPLKDYREALCGLREKGYSFQEIANWISELLGVEVNRNQVVYVVNMDPLIQNEEDENEENGDTIADLEIQRTPIDMPPHAKKARKPRKKATP